MKARENLGTCGIPEAKRRNHFKKKEIVNYVKCC